MPAAKQKKRILLVNPYPYYASGIGDVTMYPPLGLAYIAAVLERAGHECRIIDANVLAIGTKDTAKEIHSFGPDILGISANVATARAALELVAETEGPFLKVCGGPYPTSMPAKFLSEFDVVVRGEGEMAFLDIASGVPLRMIDGISYSRGKKIINNRQRALMENLDALPMPAYHLLPPLSRYRAISRKKPVAPIMTSRGCPYQCIYCTKNMFGPRFRARSPENVIDEVRYLVNELGARQIDVLDDNFTFDMRRASLILDGIIKEKLDIAINCQVGVRADRMTPGLVGLMRRAGVFKAGIGVESGDPCVLKRIGKHLELSKVVKAVGLLRQNGIIVQTFFMLGLPYDTEESMRKTIDFAKRLDPHIASFSVTTPFPGTPLHEIVSKEGRFLCDLDHGITHGFFSGEPSYEIRGSVKPEVVRKFYALAYKEFYGRPSKMLDLLSTARSLDELGWIKDSAMSILKAIF